MRTVSELLKRGTDPLVLKGNMRGLVELKAAWTSVTAGAWAADKDEYVNTSTEWLLLEPGTTYRATHVSA